MRLSKTATTRILLWISMLWASIATLYLLAGLLVVLHSEAGLISMLEKINSWEAVGAIAAVASAVAAFNSYKATATSNEISRRMGLIGSRRDAYHAFLALKHHMAAKTYWANEAEVAKFYYFSVDSRFLFEDALSQKIEKYYEICLDITKNHSDHGNAANRQEKIKLSQERERKLSQEIEKEILDSLK